MYIILLVLCLLQPLAVHSLQLPPRTADPLSACSTVSTAVASCVTATPSSGESPAQAQAVCLCYSSYGTYTSWIPDVFDGEVLSCANYVHTADSAQYTVFQTYEGYCSSVGDVLGIATTTTTSVLPSSITDLPCVSVEAVISSCINAAPMGQGIGPQAQASCLCYDNSIYDPTGFDDPMSTCLSYVKTAELSYYSVLSPLAGFCISAGGPTSSPATTPFKTTVIIGSGVTQTTLFQTTVSVKSGASSLIWKSKPWRFIWAFVAVALAI